ncbi:response regulator [Prosthecobacter sp.]|uniref:hybrid sensor histidine kinase/response regulator n=1 Tax=Prosthecobacter sp. TaxID=1965333 RepID=UPI002ABBE024|nr:response regulator [Prosthecobacter sp.]MDZ4403613.1 response regulator [Prosthecobacter sp.]
MITPHTPMTILVVDDDPGIARLIVRELRRDGHHTATAESGKQAIEWLRQHRADLLLLDLRLPDVKGHELIDVMASEGLRLPFIVITGQGDERVAVDMMKRGALDYLGKDVNFIAMMPAVVQSALARIREQQRLAAAEAALVQSHAELERRVIKRTAELTQANEGLHAARLFADATIEAVPASLAVLDENGVIISVNQAWHQFAATNGTLPATIPTGMNYLTVCDAAAGDGVEEAVRFAAGIREVMSGAVPRFSMEYACHSPTQQRWFIGYVTPFTGNSRPSVVVAHVDISERKRAEQVIRRLNEELEKRVEERTRALQQANQKLRQEAAMRRKLEEEILHISEHEKQRIGQDLHDDLGQQLAGIWLLSDVMKSNLIKQGSPEAESADKITGLLKNALGLTRSLARGLHPVAMQAGGLVTALDELATRTSDMFRIDCRCQCPPAIDMDNTTATHLYRIAQEAVTNAVKHGRAKEIDIELSTNPHHTVLSVKDQGKGKGKGKGLAEPDPKHRGMGLRIMNYRADIIGGILDIQRHPSGIGTTVVCTIPTPQS